MNMIPLPTITTVTAATATTSHSIVLRGNNDPVVLLPLVDKGQDKG